MKTSLCGIEFEMCDAYVDQGRKIGSDPMGYKCTKLDYQDFRVCSTCFDLLQFIPHRVSFRPSMDD